MESDVSVGSDAFRATIGAAPDAGDVTAWWQLDTVGEAGWRGVIGVGKYASGIAEGIIPGPPGPVGEGTRKTGAEHRRRLFLSIAPGNMLGPATCTSRCCAAGGANCGVEAGKP